MAAAAAGSTGPIQLTWSPLTLYCSGFVVLSRRIVSHMTCTVLAVWVFVALLGHVLHSNDCPMLGFEVH